MKPLKRALLSLQRLKQKSLLLFLLTFILTILLVGALSVESSVTGTIANLRRRMPAVVTTYHDFNRFNNTIDWDNVPEGVAPALLRERVSASHIRQLGELEQVEAYEYVIQWSFQSLEFLGYFSEIEGRDWEPHMDSFSLVGTSNTTLAHVENERIELIAGRSFQEDELTRRQYVDSSVVIISEAVAQANDLMVGSTFNIPVVINHLRNYEGNWGSLGWGWGEQFLEENIYTTLEVEVTIIGLFDLPDRILNPQNELEEREVLNQTRRLNTVYMPNWVIEELMLEQRSIMRRLEAEADFDLHPNTENMIHREVDVRSIFTLTDPLLFDEFSEAASIVLPEFYGVVDMSGSFRTISFSMEILQDIADWILYFSIGSLLIITILLLALYLRDRRQEIGIYLALGEKKIKIIYQILLEVLLVTLLSITLALLVGSSFSDSLSRWMLQREMLELYEEQSDMIAFDPGAVALMEIGIPRRNMSQEEMLDAFDMSLSLEVIITFYGIALGTVFLSVLISTVYIVRLNPKKILF